MTSPRDAGQRPVPPGRPPAGSPTDPRTARLEATPPPSRIAAAQQRRPLDLATRLDGQRGWLHELDRSLKKRSIVALVLTCLAVGVGAAALYISITKNADADRISALQTRVDALETATGGGPAAAGTTGAGTLPGDSNGVGAPPAETVSPGSGTTSGATP